MPSDFLRALISSNMVTWYLLPLIELNKVSFGDSNFIESYVSPLGAYLTIEVTSLAMCRAGSYKENAWFKGEQEMPAGVPSLIWYRLPERYITDGTFEAFKTGRFSHMSTKAKRMIREYSGLSSGAVYEGHHVSDARLWALDRNPQLVKKWEEELGVTTLSVDDELLPVPSTRNYREYK